MEVAQICVVSFFENDPKTSEMAVRNSNAMNHNMLSIISRSSEEHFLRSLESLQRNHWCVFSGQLLWNLGITFPSHTDTPQALQILKY